jgi:Tol biopolymer transport system component
VTKDVVVSLWAFSLRDRKSLPFDSVQSGNPTAAVFSPDGHWIAYASSHTRGANIPTAVFVQPFPGTGAKYEISAPDRGHHPVWSPDGKKLFYVPGPTRFLSVAVNTAPSFTFSNPVAVPRVFGSANPITPRTFDIAPDGRIVGIVAGDPSSSSGSAAQEIRVVLNWSEELKQRVPTR